MNYRIFPPEDLPEATITLPLSKSISNRALIINALNPANPHAGRVAECTDTAAVIHALSCGDDVINVGNAGTAMRFLTAYFAVQPGRVTVIDGCERMRIRPIGPLVDCLRQCGAVIEYIGEEGFPPLRVRGTNLDGGAVSIDGSVSSQFVSALLMVAPLMKEGITITIEGATASLPYIDMTLSLMCRAGASAEREGNVIRVAPCGYSVAIDTAEADWSAASYWYETVALTSGFITLPDLTADSLQGDRACAAIFGQLGVTTSDAEDVSGAELAASPEVAPRLNMDMSATPDLAQTVAVTCAMIGIPFRLCGLGNLRIKETDRIKALAAELRKIGVEAETGADYIAWGGRRMPIIEMPEFDTWGDHRMAMSLAPVAAYVPGIVIRDAEVVEKSYPDFWNDLRATGFTVVDAENNPVEGSCV